MVCINLYQLCIVPMQILKVSTECEQKEMEEAAFGYGGLSSPGGLFQNLKSTSVFIGRQTNLARVCFL